MIRVGVFSDSHGDRDALEKLLDKMGHIDAACFLGDISSDAMFLRDQLEKMPHQPVLYAVRGNNDLASMLPDQLLIEFDKHKIWMEHGHLFPSLMTLAYRAKVTAQISHCSVTHMNLIVNMPMAYSCSIQVLLAINAGEALHVPA